MTLTDLFMTLTVPVLAIVVIFGKDFVGHLKEKEQADPSKLVLTFYQAKIAPLIFLAIFAGIHYVLILEVARHVTEPVMRFIYGALLALPVYTMCAVALALYYLVVRFRSRRRE
ncbi:MAG TPA: hypothetical protein DEQ38_06000 [Elusimicrobia bacterium]|nr:MAG: hypothetical protein A2089_13825 [Elusimicrobia bacterium GWD2_63_28]OGR79994.1 MAG: hypothetical protein A2X38_00845 [Elusimicrobia bacterium GWC2_61_25]HCC47654.1 hypothetical protein [Elusimicrobiota bacterium]